MISKEDLKKLDPKKISEEIETAEVQLFEAQFKNRTGQSKESNSPKNLKRFIARAKTIRLAKLREQSTQNTSK